MSGNTFKDTSPISLDELENIWTDLIANLAVVSLSNVTPVGTTWKKEVMGDIDIAATLAANVTSSRLVEVMRHVFGEENVKRNGGSIISLRYPFAFSKRFVQVDIMLGDVTFIKWSRFGPSTIENHPHFSPVKGVIRNLFLNTVLRETTTEFDKEDPLQRQREILNFDVGLYHVWQTKHGTNSRELKSWTTHSQSWISSNPDNIVERIFGHGKAEDALTFEDCLCLAKNSGKFDKDTFVKELSDIIMTNPKTLGENLVDPIKYVRDECKW